MDKNKIIENMNEESEDSSWKMYAVKQGYLIKFHRGLLKAPKMQYFVLTANGLISFEGKPNNETKPLSFLPYEQLSSIKLDQIELNSSKLCCMQLTSKSSPSFTLGFNRKEERDDWMMTMMKAFSEALLTTRIFNRTSKAIEEGKESSNDDIATKLELERKISTGSNAQSLRRKRRKGEKGSIRRSKSFDSLKLHDVTNTPFNFPSKKSDANPLRVPEAESASHFASRKRKSEPDVHVVSHFPGAWTTESIKEKSLATSCSFEHRDSLTVQADKLLKKRSESKQKSNSVFAKLRSKLEHPAKTVH